MDALLIEATETVEYGKDDATGELGEEIFNEWKRESVLDSQLI
jgi:hypothetical protein